MRELDYNLSHSHTDYKELDGEQEPKFREWTYRRLEQRQLLEGLIGCALRPADTKRLASDAGLAIGDLKGLDPKSVLRSALEAMGVHEPIFPAGIEDGTEELRRSHEEFNKLIVHGRLPTTTDETFTSDGEGPVDRCRRGAEHLLKTIILFYIDAEFENLFRAVMTEGLHGFRAQNAPPEDLGDAILNSELGTLNHLLKSASKELKVRASRPSFLPPEVPLWHHGAFGAINALAGALGLTVHDKATGKNPTTAKARLAQQHKMVDKVVDHLDTSRPLIRVPKVVRFHKRIEDGHSVHFTGYNSDKKKVSF